MRYFFVLLFVSGCTSILGDFEVVDDNEWLTRKHCRSHQDCKDNFHPEAVCKLDAGNTCVVYVEAGKD